MKMTPRNETRQVKIGNYYMGGNERIYIQSMCNIKTSKVDEVVKQINECALLGADLMRVSVLDMEDAKAIKGTEICLTISLIALASSMSKTETRIKSAPNKAHSLICLTISSTFEVLILHIDWIKTLLDPPMVILPIFIRFVSLLGVIFIPRL